MSSSPTTHRSNPKISLDWTYLPFLPLQLIARKLPTIADFVRFRCVCSSWRSAAKPADLPPHLPWLMFPSEFSWNSLSGSNNQRGFFSLPDRKIHRFPLPPSYSFDESRCLPFIHGWILIIRTSPNIYLFNPLTRARIPLPPLTAFPGLVFGYDNRRLEKEYGVLHGRRQRRRMSCEQMRDQFIISAVMSANPAASPSSRCVIMVALYSTWKLAFCRPGDAEWTVVDTTFRNRVCSMTCCGNNKFYATDGERMAVCDPFASPVKATVIASFEQSFDRRYYSEAATILCSRWICDTQFYLVESAGNVLLIKRYRGNEDYMNGWKDHFDVWRCDVNAEEPKWDWVSDMGDRALFLCGNHSMSVKASDFSSGCRANCIYYDGPFFELNEFYFSDTSSHFGGYEVAVFDKKDGSREMIPCYYDSELDWKKSAWFCPSLC